VVVKYKEADATKKQLYKLHELTGEDTREWKLTRQEASDRIEELELEALPDIVDDTAEENGFNDEPFTEAHVTIIEGDQRGGKTNTAVGMIVDSYDGDCVKIFYRKVAGRDCEVISYDRKHRVAKIKVDGITKLIKIPKEYKLKSPMRIFSRIHLYGLPYVYVPSYRYMLKWLKNGIISNGWLLADEAYRGMSARNSMSEMGKEWVAEYFQFGKSRLDVIIITHHAKMIDFLARTIPTRRIHCTYNEKTRMVTYTSRRHGETGTKEVTYDATQYWGNYRTNEKVNS